MNITREITKAASITLFLTAGVMCYAFVYDVEPILPEKHYTMDRDIYNRSLDSHYEPFPDFNTWLGQQEEKEQRFHDWVMAVFDETKRQSADLFDWRVHPENVTLSPEQWDVVYGRD